MQHSLASPDEFTAFVHAPIRGLLLDDSSFDRARIKRMSRQSYLNIELDEVDSLSEMKSAADRESYDLFLIDYRLPDGDGLKALRVLRQDARHASAGSILITGNPAVDTTVNAMRCGYNDVLSKDDITPDHLSVAVLEALKSARIEAEQARPLTRRDLHDGLSNAFQDPDIQSKLHQALATYVKQQARENGSSLTSDRLSFFMKEFLEDDDFDFSTPS
jgi:PleD family two-component response regulator